MFFIDALEVNVTAMNGKSSLKVVGCYKRSENRTEQRSHVEVAVH